MKKFLLPLLFIFSISASFHAQNKIDLAGRAMLDDYYMKLGDRAQGIRTEANEAGKTEIAAVVTLSDNASREEIEAKGYQVLAGVGDMIVISIPITEIESFAKLDDVSYVSFGNKVQPMLNNARQSTFVDPVQLGQEDLPHAFTGSGVLTGLYDSGVQPNHINFKTADGMSRVKGIWEVQSGKLTEYLTPTAIAGFKTDNPRSSHGTHVLGCMAGSYNGAGRYAGNSSPSDGNIPFYGSANGSDILVGCGTLYTSDILVGVDRMVKYAKEAGKPLVINLSLGSNNGPHDGTSDVCRMLAEYGKDAIIAVAAGNEGDQRMAVTRTFNNINKQLRTFLAPQQLGVAYSGVVDFYSSIDEPLEFSVVLFDIADKKIVYEFPVNENTNGNYKYLASKSFNNPNYTQTEYFDNAYGSGSYIRVGTEVDPNNNRYHVRVEPNLKPGADNYTRVGFVIKGKSGSRVNGYALSSDEDFAITFSNYGVSGWLDGSRDGSISDMACGKNIIVIGSYNTRESWYVLDGRRYSYNDAGFEVGAISPFSSFGTTYDGRALPTLCAPGAAIISSYSSEYVSATNMDRGRLAAKASDDSGTYYWGEMQGTSMSTPLAAGVFAQWLEADPHLTISDIVDVAKTTAYRDAAVSSTGSSTQWGAGKLDALAGVKKILANSGIGTVFDEDEEDKIFIVTPIGTNSYDIFVAGAATIKAELYSINGSKVLDVSSTSNETHLDASGLTPAIYLLKVTTPNNVFSRKLVIR